MLADLRIIIVIAIIKTCFKFRSKQLLLKLYFGYYVPCILYGSIVWLTNEDTLKNTLFKAFKRFWRLSEGKFNLPKVHNLHQLALKQSLAHLFKMREKKVNMDFDDYFKFCNSHNTRNHENKNLKKLKFRLNGRKNTFSQMIVPWFNRLGPERETKSLATFKKCVDSMIELYLPTPEFEMRRKWWGS